VFALFQTLPHQNPCTHRSLIISLSTLSLFHVFSLCFTSVSLPLLQVRLSLSLAPSSSAVNPFFYLIISHPRSPLSLLHVSFSPSVSGAPLSLPCRYLQYCRTECHPRLSESASTLLQNNYVKIRQVFMQF
jgi:hypothetical protein